MTAIIIPTRDNPLIAEQTADTLNACRSVLTLLQAAGPNMGEIKGGSEGLDFVLTGVKMALEYEAHRCSKSQ